MYEAFQGVVTSWAGIALLALLVWCIFWMIAIKLNWFVELRKRIGIQAGGTMKTTFPHPLTKSMMPIRIRKLGQWTGPFSVAIILGFTTIGPKGGENEYCFLTRYYNDGGPPDFTPINFQAKTLIEDAGVTGNPTGTSVEITNASALVGSFKGLQQTYYPVKVPK